MMVQASQVVQWLNKQTNLPANAGAIGDVGLIPGSRRSPGGGNGNPLQYSCQDNLTNRSLGGYSPGGCRESDMTEHTPIYHLPI